MVQRSSMMFAWLVLGAVACGGAEEGGEAKSAANPPETSANTTAQNKLGRFVSADGRVAIVLDRSGSTAKLQVEGEKDIFELTEREARRSGGGLSGYEYVDPNNKVRVLIGTSGSVTYVNKGDELPMTFDKATAALGAATVAGPPKKAVASYQAASDALSARSVVKKFPEFKADDSTDLTKVAAAFAKADAASFARYVKAENGSNAYMQVAPSNVSGPGFGRQNWKTDEAELAKHKKLAAYGAVIHGYSDAQSQGNHIIAESKDHPMLASNTPGLIWAVDDYRITFVSFDGGRYEVDLPQSDNKGTEPFVDGLGAEASWPKPVQNAFLDYTEVGRLSKIGQAPKELQASLEKADDDWNICAQGVWKAANAKIEVQKFKPEDAKALSVKTQSTCRKHLDAFENTLVAFLDKRKAERAAIFDKAKARASSLGVK